MLSKLKDKSKLQKKWYMYDWAVSAYTTTVITVFIGPYLTTIAESATLETGGKFLSILGIPIHYGSLFPYTISLSVILQILILPLIGAISDQTGKKTTLLTITTLIGSVSTMLFFFLEGNNYILGSILVLFSNLAFGGAMVVYNSFLNEIAQENERDKVSSNGYAYGYIGGGILLALNLALYSQSESLGLSSGLAVRLCLASAGLWWGGFALITIFGLKSVNNKGTQSGNLFQNAFSGLFTTVKQSFAFPLTLLFLLAYIFYNDGVQAVIVVSSQFGQEAVGLDISTLTSVILMVQFVAYFGAIIFGKLAERINTQKALLISILIWIALVFYAYEFLDSAVEFWILGFVIGLVLGGTQALSRSLFSLLIPKGKDAEYFSLYEVSERGTSWIGPLLFGLSLQLTDSFKIAIFSLGILFVIGFIILVFINIPKAIKNVGNVVPDIFIK